MRPAIPIALPIALEWEQLVPLLSRANRSIARFDGILMHLRNPDLLRTPLITREAVLSSKIEGTVVTVGEVLRFQAGDVPETESKRLDFAEVVNYRKALRAAQTELVQRPFCLNLVLKLHAILLDSVRGYNKRPGSFRTMQNHIGRPGSSMEEAEFVPPDPLCLKLALGNWERYYHQDEKDPLVQLAIVHAQFEFLHPFLDGNGRIGRILVPLFLFDKKVLSTPTFYLSEYLEEHRDEYIYWLRQLDGTGKSWTAWCKFFLEAMAIQAERNADKVKNILALYEELKLHMVGSTNSKFAVPLLDAMYEMPIFQASSLLDFEGMPQRQFLMRMLGRLVDEQVLTIVQEGRGRRATLYSLHQLVSLCDTARIPAKRKARGAVGMTIIPSPR
jgi:Fic family protein